MPWEQQESVVQKAMETLKERHVGEHTAVRNDGVRPSNTDHMSSSQCQLQFQIERTEWEVLARHMQQLENELSCVKGMLAMVMEFGQNADIGTVMPEENVKQNQPPIPTKKTSIVNLVSSLSKAVKKGRPAKKQPKAAMVDLKSLSSKAIKRGKPAKK